MSRTLSGPIDPDARRPPTRPLGRGSSQPAASAASVPCGRRWISLPSPTVGPDRRERTALGRSGGGSGGRGLAEPEAPPRGDPSPPSGWV